MRRNPKGRPAVVSACIAVGTAAALGAGWGFQGPSVQFVVLKGERKNRFEYEVKYPRIEGESAVVRMAAKIIRFYAESGVAEVRRSKGNDVPKAGKTATLHGQLWTVSIANNSLVSAFVQQSDYLGGAHDAQSIEAVNVGLVAGKAKQLSLSDLGKKGGADIYKVCEAIVRNKLAENPRSFLFEDENPFDVEIERKQLDRFAITRTGITFLFQPYEVGPFSSGFILVKVGYGELKSLLDPAGPLRPVFGANGSKGFPW